MADASRMQEGQSSEEDREAGSREQRSRARKPFPSETFENSLTLGLAIQEYAAGQRVRRLTLFDKMGRSPESGPSRELIIASGRYGITVGGKEAEYLELTDLGRIATSSEASPEERLRAQFRLAVQSVEIFHALYEQNKGSKLPSKAVLIDSAIEHGCKPEQAEECVQTFLANVRFLGLVRELSGTERLISIEHRLEDLRGRIGETTYEATGLPDLSDVMPLPARVTTAPVGGDGAAGGDWERICFYITPIGEPSSEERKHSDLFLGSIVEPALAEFDLRVVRADRIGKSGMIGPQIIQYIVHSRLVIADLSFHNPNVFYELCLRHFCRKPIVQLIRSSDRIPFDLEQFRTIKIDTGNIYTLVPKLDLYRSEIAAQVRDALADPNAVDNPISVFAPSLRAVF